MAETQHNPKWISYDGQFTFGEEIVFHGEMVSPTPAPLPDQQPTAASATEAPNNAVPDKQVAHGRAISNQYFREGTVTFQLMFDQVDDRTLGECVLQFGSAARVDFAVGLGGEQNTLFDLREFRASDDPAIPTVEESSRYRWSYHFAGGDRRQLQPGRVYSLSIKVRGSALTLTIDDVEVARAILPSTFRGGQLGLMFFCGGKAYVRQFRVVSLQPIAFVVMQFNAPEYDDLYRDVIAETCREVGIAAYRADETFEPGLVVADIQRRIAESRIVIAEITPANPNVYYEVGYADALRKPIILLASRDLKQLPFDIAPYRTIFYDNTIGGKSKVQNQLKRYLALLFGAEAEKRR